MPIFNVKDRALVTFHMVPLYLHIVVKGLWQHALLDPTLSVNVHLSRLIVDWISIQTVSENILSVPEFEPQSLDQTANT